MPDLVLLRCKNPSSMPEIYYLKDLVIVLGAAIVVVNGPAPCRRPVDRRVYFNGRPGRTHCIRPRGRYASG